MADPIRRQVRTETRLRYGQTLGDLLGGRHALHHQYVSDVAGAELTARAVQQGAKASIPQLRAIYDDAERTRNQAAAQIQAAIGVAGPSSALAAALMADRGAATQDAVAERASSQADAVRTGRRAIEGLAYTKRSLLSDYRAGRGELMAKTRDLHSEMGAFAQSRLGELRSDQAAAQSKERDRIIAETGYDPLTGQPTLQGRKDIASLTGKDPFTGKPIPGARNGRGRTRAEQRQVNVDSANARDAIAEARAWIRRLTAGGNAITKVVPLLKMGGSIPVPVPSGKKDKSGNPIPQTDARGNTKYTQMSVPAIKGDFLRAAVELEDRGYLTKTSIHNLRTRGVHVPKSWVPKPFKLAADFAPEVTRY